MRVAILSAGPSLARTFDPEARHDLRIAVNAAAGLHPCDWWSCGDGQTFARVEPIGLPVLFTLDPADGWYRTPAAARRLPGHRVVGWSELKRRIEPPAPPGAAWDWSITAALVLAVDQGAGHIQVFGHDMAGTVDVAGHELAKRADNWRRVRAAFDATCTWADQRGVLVDWIQPCT